jgi:tRNA 2-thiouridine synthesizing protein A
MPCPQPIIELARNLESVPVGGLIAVSTTDVAARVDVPAWCRMRGQEFVGESAAADGAIVLTVRRVGESRT